MKNKGLIITMIVFWTIVIVVLIAFLCYIITGNSINWGTYHRNTKSEILYDEIYELEQIKDIEVLASAGDIKFEESTDIQKVRVLVKGNNSKNIKLELQGGKLKIDDTKNKSINSIFSFNNYIDEITIYIPQNYNQVINLKVDYGNIDSISLENATLNIDSSCGDVKLGKVKNLKVNSDYGNVKVESVLNKLDIETDCGNVKIDNVDLKEASRIKSDLGDVKIKNTNDIYIDASVDLGDCKINNNNRHGEITLKIEVDCGDIKVEN